MTDIRPYPLSNLHAASTAHHDALSDLLDDDTMYRIMSLIDRESFPATGLASGTWAGASMLEVGAGAGSVAQKMRYLVGDSGRVVALDLHPAIEPDGNLEVVQLDLLSDDPLPEGPFHLIHARLTLGHLPPRREITARLVERLAPGGWLCLEDFRARRDGIAVAGEGAEIIEEFQRTVGEKVFDAHGTDRGWAPSIHGVLRDLGLSDVETKTFSSYWGGGNAGARFLTAIHAQTYDRMLAAGMAKDRLDRVPDIMARPETLIHGHEVFSVVAQRA
ncbi:SAM-dependent methyltransferase [Catenuloplanes nepalensis]|uniref:SAM-dependent methyltransferase n=1 Tax=Catenuloplanes nepalensis TaxID=587533 RepID=A0ABT9MQ15_9ACTN|nr:class I SAM-dependent methyltransferase [Catenuloplanes nepalensis]MDP9793507.1 SAM-dependent methyltransferase [Catenuloplanes nepalensis]